MSKKRKMQDWTFRNLRTNRRKCAPVGATNEFGRLIPGTQTFSIWSQWTTWAGIGLVGLVVIGGISVGITYTVLGSMGLLTPVDTTTGSHIHSAMRLSGVAEDGDQEQVLHFVVSEMGARFGYKELECRGGYRRLDTILWYKYERAPPELLQYNDQLSEAIPSRLHPHRSESWWGKNAGASSCICGYNDDQMMQILYNEDTQQHRVAVTVHEYYHVIQIHYCEETYSTRQNFVMWLSEGGATVYQHFHSRYWFEGRNVISRSGQAGDGYQDNMFDATFGCVEQMRQAVQANTWTYSSALESYAAAQNNYIASTTAVLYLIYRVGGNSASTQAVWDVMVDYLISGECGMHEHSSRDAGFQHAFGIWSTVNAFYSDLNAWLGSASNTDRLLLRPPDAAINTLFNYTTLCSDVCETSRNGVCDASCLYGSDCTDCGVVGKPGTWPITLSAEYQRP